MQLLITKRNDITPLFGMDWLKEFNLTNQKHLLDRETNQKETSDQTIAGSIQEQHYDERHRKKHTTQTGTLSGETKSET